MKKDYGKKNIICFLLALAYPISLNTFKSRRTEKVFQKEKHQTDSMDLFLQ